MLICFGKGFKRYLINRNSRFDFPITREEKYDSKVYIHVTNSAEARRRKLKDQAARGAFSKCCMASSADQVQSCKNHSRADFKAESRRSSYGGLLVLLPLRSRRRIILEYCWWFLSMERREIHFQSRQRWEEGKVKASENAKGRGTNECRGRDEWLCGERVRQKWGNEKDVENEQK